jgi:hypothetical protein
MILTLLSVTLLAAAPQIPPAQCVTANGKTGCGYACRAASNEVRCASTPYGTCATFGTEVICFDPPASVVHHPPNKGLSPMCRRGAFESACGFNCLVVNGKAACSRTPYGVCKAHFNELRCWDPPESSIHESGAEIPQPSCLTASTAMECGYDCKTSRAEVKCASTPRGRCERRGNEITCFDPPTLTQCSHAQPPDPGEVRKPKSQRQE